MKKETKEDLEMVIRLGFMLPVGSGMFGLLIAMNYTAMMGLWAFPVFTIGGIALGCFVLYLCHLLSKGMAENMMR
jgi:hypothetical protein